MINTRTLTLIVVVALSTSANAQQPLQNWIDAQIKSQLQEKGVEVNPTQLKKEQVVQNGKGVDRQRESPSNDPRSTSLVDQSSASDFFSVAANLIPVTPGLSQVVSSSGGASSDSSAAGSTTATASLYAILAALNKTSPTDPDFYAAHVNARRFFFTIGTAASKQATDNTDTPTTVYGTKILLINGRELYYGNNLTRIKNVQNALGKASAASAALTPQIAFLIFKQFNPDDVDDQGRPKDLKKFQAFVKDHLATEGSWDQTLNSLSFDTKKQIQAMITASIGPFVEERKTLIKEYDAISKAMQMSLSYTANIRDEKGNNDHRAELIFDYGLSPSINWTVNASGDYTDRKTAQRSAGGRFATSFQGDLTKSGPGDLKTPMRLTFSGEGKWLTKQKPQYTFEAGLSIPVTAGIDVPLVYRYANRIAQLNRKDSEARLGFSIDMAHLTQAFGRK